MKGYTTAIRGMRGQPLHYKCSRKNVAGLRLGGGGWLNEGRSLMTPRTHRKAGHSISKQKTLPQSERKELTP